MDSPPHGFHSATGSPGGGSGGGGGGGGSGKPPSLSPRMQQPPSSQFAAFPGSSAGGGASPAGRVQGGVARRPAQGGSGERGWRRRDWLRAEWAGGGGWGLWAEGGLLGKGGSGEGMGRGGFFRSASVDGGRGAEEDGGTDGPLVRRRSGGGGRDPPVVVKRSNGEEEEDVDGDGDGDIPLASPLAKYPPASPLKAHGHHQPLPSPLSRGPLASTFSANPPRPGSPLTRVPQQQQQQSESSGGGGFTDSSGTVVSQSLPRRLVKSGSERVGGAPGLGGDGSFRSSSSVGAAAAAAAAGGGSGRGFSSGAGNETSSVSSPRRFLKSGSERGMAGPGFPLSSALPVAQVLEGPPSAAAGCAAAEAHVSVPEQRLGRDIRHTRMLGNGSLKEQGSRGWVESSGGGGGGAGMGAGGAGGHGSRLGGPPGIPRQWSAGEPGGSAGGAKECGGNRGLEAPASRIAALQVGCQQATAVQVLLQVLVEEVRAA
ncbi:unnamed protein product [Closterium sp. NIES-65]|nr:unnamed protein product [Closterium sp. NIES-65]